MYMYTKQRNKTNTNTKGENKQNKGKTNKKSKLCTSIQNEKGTRSTRNINELSMYGGYHIKTDKEIWRRYTFMKLKISYQPVSKDMQILR